MDNSGHGPARPAEVPPEVPAEVTARTLPGEVAEIVGEISEATSPSRRRKLTAAVPRLARRSGRATWFGVQSGSRWLTAEVLAMAPRLPVRDQLTLRAQFPGLPSAYTPAAPRVPSCRAGPSPLGSLLRNPPTR